MEPFSTPYFEHELQFTEEDIYNSIYPMATYANFVSLLILAPLAESVGYKKMFLFGICTEIVAKALLLWGTELSTMLLMQMLTGVSAAALMCLTGYMFVIITDSYSQPLVYLSPLFGITKTETNNLL